MGHYDEFREQISGEIENTATWHEFKEQHYDSVNKPKHYNSHPSGIQCIEITEHMNFCLGNAIKYLWRAGLKESTGIAKQAKKIEDLEKAIWYIQREIKKLQEKQDDKET